MKRKIMLFTILALLVPSVSSAKTVDELYNEFFPNGEYNSNSVVPENFEEAEYIFTYTSRQFKLDDNNSIYITCDDDNRTNCLVGILGDDGNRELPLKVNYNNPNENVLKKYNQVKENFPTTKGTERLFYRIEDLELINYLYNGGNIDDYDINTINIRMNYSLELKQVLENTNFEAFSDIRAGGDGPFCNDSFGGLTFIYDGFIYGSLDKIGTTIVHALYIPDDTNDNTEDYIDAALKRIEQYVGKDVFTITYGGLLSSVDETDYSKTISDLVDITKTLNEYYTLKINDTEMKIVIVKDSSKMQEIPVITTTDAKSDASISSSSSQMPIDSKIKIKPIVEDSEEYKKLVTSLKLDKAYIYDIDLISNLKNGYIKTLSNGNFKVYIPLPEEYKNKELVVYYVKDDGTKEEHQVNVENGFATFETNHFSTYSLTTVEKTNNPNTFDNISLYIIIESISLTCILLCALLNKKYYFSK